MRQTLVKFLCMGSLITVMLSTNLSTIPAGTINNTQRTENEKIAVQDAQNINNVVSYEESGKIQYVDYYGGCYIREDGRLVVQLYNCTDAEKQKLQAVVSQNVIFEEVDDSYQELIDAIEKNSKLLAELVAKNAAGELSKEVSELVTNIVGMETRVQDNVNVVHMLDISEEMQARFKQYFGDAEIIFEPSAPAETTKGTAWPETKISKKSLSMYPNKVKKLKLKNVSAKVTWSSSKKNLVKILGTTGANQETVTIRTTGKTGKCTVKATVGNQTYTCKIKVKDDKNCSGITLKKVQKTTDAIYLKVNLKNTSSKALECAPYDYIVEKFENGTWSDVTPKRDAITSEMRILQPKSEATATYLIARGEEEISKTNAGLYRLTIKCFKKAASNYVLFTLK